MTMTSMIQDNNYVISSIFQDLSNMDKVRLKTEQTFKTEIGTINKRDACCSICLLQTVTHGSIVRFPQFKDVTKYVCCQLQQHEHQAEQ